jgi:hypothetical protein
MARDPAVPVDSFGVYELAVADFEWRRPASEGNEVPLPTREGGCHCGQLRYRISAEPLAVAVCYCLDCQRQSGSAFGMTMVIPVDGFAWLNGEPSSFFMKSDSGADKECLFCGNCGVRIFNRFPARPATVNLKPGTLDETTGITPTLQVFSHRKPAWVSVPESVPTFPRETVGRS